MRRPKRSTRSVIRVAILAGYGIPHEDWAPLEIVTTRRAFIWNAAERAIKEGIPQLIIVTGGKVRDLPAESSYILPLLKRDFEDLARMRQGETASHPTYLSEDRSTNTYTHATQSLELLREWLAKSWDGEDVHVEYYCRPEWICMAKVSFWFETRRIFNPEERQHIKVMCVPIHWRDGFQLVSFVYNILLEAPYVILSSKHREELRHAGPDYIPWVQKLLNKRLFRLGDRIRRRT